jgi:putative membrane protein
MVFSHATVTGPRRVRIDITVSCFIWVKERTMKRVTGALSIALVAVLILVLSPAWGQQPQKLNTKDRDFLKEIAQIRILELKLGEKALQNATNADVKKFAQRMVQQHGQANRELDSLANTRGVQISKDLDTKHKEVLDKLSSMKGADFDREYIRQLVKDHEQDIAELQKASKEVQDAELKAWVTKMLPTLNDHLREARAIQSQIGQK